MEDMTEAEKEDLEVRKRRAEGTPCNKENFLAWKKRFEVEMAKKSEEERDLEKMDMNKRKSGKGSSSEVDKSGRPTGYQLFTNKSNTLDIFEAAAENAERDSEDDDDDEEMDNVQEDLFDDDVDLDDLDFDDDDEDFDEDDDEEEEEEDLDI